MPQADLVLEGGGVKGIALAGAVATLAEAGYRFPRIAGTSAGAVVAAVTAALQHAGEPPGRLADVVRTLDYAKLRDEGALERITGTIGEAAALLLSDGVYRGGYLHDWLTEVLRDLGVRTFGDLRRPPDPKGTLPADFNYSLVVTAGDVAKRLLVRLPWDYRALYGRDPDEQPVALAVQASAAIPFFFRPVRIRAVGGAESTLVDGGLLSAYPIGIFDRTDGRPPRWPTFGVRLTARPTKPPVSHPVHGPLSLLLAMVETMLTAVDAVHIDDRCDLARTVFIDASWISPVDFGITATQQIRLYDAGARAAATFLAGWDFPGYMARCR